MHLHSYFSFQFPSVNPLPFNIQPFPTSLPLNFNPPFLTFFSYQFFCIALSSSTNPCASFISNSIYPSILPLFHFIFFFPPISSLSSPLQLLLSNLFLLVSFLIPPLSSPFTNFFSSDLSRPFSLSVSFLATLTSLLTCHFAVLLTSSVLFILYSKLFPSPPTLLYLIHHNSLHLLLPFFLSHSFYSQNYFFFLPCPFSYIFLLSSSPLPPIFHSAFRFKSLPHPILSLSLFPPLFFIFTSHYLTSTCPLASLLHFSFFFSLSSHFPSVTDVFFFTCFIPHPPLSSCFYLPLTTPLPTPSTSIPCPPLYKSILLIPLFSPLTSCALSPSLVPCPATSVPYVCILSAISLCCGPCSLTYPLIWPLSLPLLHLCYPFLHSCLSVCLSPFSLSLPLS